MIDTCIYMYKFYCLLSFKFSSVLTDRWWLVNAVQQYWALDPFFSIPVSCVIGLYGSRFTAANCELRTAKRNFSFGLRGLVCVLSIDVSVFDSPYVCLPATHWFERQLMANFQLVFGLSSSVFLLHPILILVFLILYSSQAIYNQ